METKLFHLTRGFAWRNELKMIDVWAVNRQMQNANARCAQNEQKFKLFKYHMTIRYLLPAYECECIEFIYWETDGSTYCTNQTTRGLHNTVNLLQTENESENMYRQCLSSECVLVSGIVFEHKARAHLVDVVARVDGHNPKAAVASIRSHLMTWLDSQNLSLLEEVQSTTVAFIEHSAIFKRLLFAIIQFSQCAKNNESIYFSKTQLDVS